VHKTLKTFLLSTAAGVIAATSAANAGGFAVREQSTSSQGASFAGSAAGGDLSSMFWNPAALGASEGTNMESHAAIFFGRSNLEADAPGAGSGVLNNALGGLVNPSSGDIAEDAVIPSSYFGMQLSPDFWVGMGINSPFGLVTKPADRDWMGSTIARKSKIFTINANPNVAYQIMPGVTIGAGLQVQYMQGQLKFATAAFPGGSPSASFDGDDVGFGATAGIYLNPMEGTQIGLGYRSQIKHTLKGDFGVVGGSLLPGFLPASVGASADITTPDVVTFSIRQAVSPSMRLMGTFEWTNWSTFDSLTLSNAAPVNAASATIPANWHDAWFASVGAEYDVSHALTVRAGVAYEESPIQNDTERLTPVPDSDRVWVSAGATYKLNHHTTLDFAYTHVFVEKARFDREPATQPGVNLTGTAETSVDIVSFSMKSKLDADHPIFGGFFQ